MVFIIITICIFLFVGIQQKEKYHSLIKTSWEDNIMVLAFLSFISLLLIGFACEIGDKYNKTLGPYLYLMLIFYIIWMYSLIVVIDFEISKICSLIVFILTATILITLGLTKEKTLSLVALPFLVFTIINIILTRDIFCKNTNSKI